jgi:hypothetical protein
MGTLICEALFLTLTKFAPNDRQAKHLSNGNLGSPEKIESESRLEGSVLVSNEEGSDPYKEIFGLNDPFVLEIDSAEDRKRIQA